MCHKTKAKKGVQMMNVYKEKDACCGCGVCAEACPKNAICLKPDEYGFFYPTINEKKCVLCGICKKVCGFRNESKKKECINAYAVAIKNDNILVNSASGGAFYAIAKHFICNHGVVFGSSSEYQNDSWVIKHIEIKHIDELWKIQGSKYVQSKTEDVFYRVKELLKSGVKVLFSGTPCQIANLYSYLDKEGTDNLYTIDIICHGVPSPIYFEEYIKILEKKVNGSIIDFKFRDKTRGWGLNAKYVVQKKTGKRKQVVLSSGCSSYYHYFLCSEIYRDCCYSCRYATKDRVGDITLGDFWGFEDFYPSCIKENGGKFNSRLGISCVLVNSDKGKFLLEAVNDDLVIYDSDIETIAKKNHQLKECSVHSEKREELLKLFREFGYLGIENKYKTDLGRRYYLMQIKNKCINIISTFKW